MNEETLEYRLNNIETALIELKDLITEIKLQQKDIEKLEENSKKQTEEIAEIKKDLAELKSRPVKENALKWKAVVDTIFKVLVTGLAGWFLVRLGIS